MTASFVAALAFAASVGAQTVKIGVLAPLTGDAASDGQSVQNSIQLAVERINKEGGVLGKKVEVVIYDDRADPKEATALAMKLIEQDKIAGFVGGSYSMPTRVVAPIFQEEKVPLVAAYAVHPDVTGAGEYCFRNGFLGTVEGKCAAYTCVELLKGKRVALLTSDNDFGRTLAEGFKQYMATKGAKAQLVSVQTYPMAEKDFKAYLAKIKEAKADVIFSSGYYFQTGPAVKQAREMGITAKIVGEEGADSPGFVEIAGAAAEGFVIVTNLNRDDPRPDVQNYIKDYETRFKLSPDMVGASAYDAFMILCDSMNRAKSLEGPAVQKAIAGIKDYSGLTGTIKGFNKGEVIKDVQVQVVKNGKFHRFGVISDPTLITP